MWKKISPEPNSGCWFWLGAHDSDGYGVLWNRRAHRVVFLTLVGEIEKPELDHKCRNRCCVNPGHLEPVTRQENATRRRLAKTHCKRGHEFTDKNTRWRGGARTCMDCQRITGALLDKRRPSGWERQRLKASPVGVNE